MDESHLDFNAALFERKNGCSEAFFFSNEYVYRSAAKVEKGGICS